MASSAEAQAAIADNRLAIPHGLPESADFRDWWSRHDVLSRLANRSVSIHLVAGLMVFEYTSFALTGRPGMKLIVYAPLDEHGSVEKL